MTAARRIAQLEQEIAGLDAELRRLDVPIRAFEVSARSFSDETIGGLCIGMAAYATPVALVRGEDDRWYLCGYFKHWPDRTSLMSMRVRRTADGWHVRDPRPLAKYRPLAVSGPDWIPVHAFDPPSLLKS